MRPRLLTLTAALAAALALGAAAAPAALASHDQTVFFEAPQDMLGVSGTVQASSFAKLESLGVHALRVVLYWGEVAPKPHHRTRPHFNQANPKAYRWGPYDTLIDAAAAHHWKILLTVSGGFGTVPRWATPHGEDEYSYPNAHDFGLFMRAVGRHYGKLVKLYSIWNEPNQPQYLRPQYVKGHLSSPRIYRRLFLAAYHGLKSSGNFHGMKVLMGETSPVGVRAAGIPAPLAFMRGVLCLDNRYRPVGHCSKLPAWGYAQHPYTVGPGPFWVPPTREDPHHDDVTMGTIGRLVTALDRAARVGAIRAHMPVYITEMGIQSHPKPAIGVSLAQQAEYDAISERLAWENPRVAAFDQYLLRDDPPTRSRNPLSRWPGFETGLETYKGKVKPAFNGFRLPLTVTRTHAGVALWGLVRPLSDRVGGPASTTAPSGATGPTGASGSSSSAAASAREVELQYSSDGGHHWRSLMRVSTDAAGVWSVHANFAKRRLWRVRWSAPDGHTFTGAPMRAYTSSGRIDY
jgi:hypothetical protein